MKYGFYYDKKDYSCFVPYDLNRNAYIDAIEKEYKDKADRLTGRLARVQNSIGSERIIKLIQSEITEEHRIKKIIENDRYREIGLENNIYNYFRAIKVGTNYLDNNTFDIFIICYLHSILMGNNSITEVRKKQNWYGKGDISTAELIFTPPELLEKKMNDLIMYMNDQSRSILCKTAIVHIQFESLHPFSDGNGRVGRLLLYLIIYKDGLINYPFLYLGRIFKHYVHYYHFCEMKIRNEDDWEYWFEFYFKTINQFLDVLCNGDVKNDKWMLDNGE